MATKWYLVPAAKTRKAEIASYTVEGSLTDFPRGVYMAYADNGVYDGEKDIWTTAPKRKKYAEAKK